MSTQEPRFSSKSERVRYAIRRYYIDEEDVSQNDIADELNVSSRVVSRYLNEAPQAEELQKARSQIEAERWKELLYDCLRRLDRLMELEDQLWDVVEPVITRYEFTEVEADIEDYHLQQGGDSLRLDLGNGADDDARNPPRQTLDIPVPADWSEVPQFNRLQRVWDERRKTQEQLTNLLGLDAADELNVTGELTENKIFSVDDSGYPDPAELTEENADGENPDDDA